MEGGKEYTLRMGDTVRVQAFELTVAPSGAMDKGRAAELAPSTFGSTSAAGAGSAFGRDGDADTDSDSEASRTPPSPSVFVTAATVVPAKLLSSPEADAAAKLLPPPPKSAAPRREASAC